MSQSEKRQRQDEWERLLRGVRTGDYEVAAASLRSAFDDVRSGAAIRIGKARWAPGASALEEQLRAEGVPHVRSALVSALARIRNPAAAPTLAGHLDDGQEDVRRLALRGLAWLRDPRVPEIALSFYANGSWTERQEALDALVRLNSPEAANALQTLRSSEEHWMRRRAIKKALRRAHKGWTD